MKINKPLSYEEYKQINCLPEGDYKFKVEACEEKLDKNGNGYFRIKLNIYGATREAKVFDNIMEVFPEKVYAYCAATGQLDAYYGEGLDSRHQIGLTGTLKLIIKKDPSGQYDDKNEVRKYYFNETKINANANPNTGSTEFVDSDLPF